jgi:hypothetical protein
MMTSEDNADRMLTKVVALSLHAARCCVFGVVLSVGLAACSYRAPDKSALHAKASAVDPVKTAVKNISAIAEEKTASDAQAVSTYPLMKTSSVGTAADKHVMAGKHGVKTIAASIDRVVGDAAVTLPMVEIPIAADEIEPVVRDVPQSIIEPASESPVPARPWMWLLAVMATTMAAGAGLTLRRRRTDAHAAARDETLPPQPNVAPAAEVVPVTFEDASDPAPVAFSSLEWSYQAPDYERQEHWDAMSPVDFLPTSLAVAVPHEVDGQDELPVTFDEVEEIRFQQDSENELSPVSEELPLSSLFDQLEALATQEGDAMPALLIERGSDLPAVLRASSEPVPSATLEAWEKLLRQAIPGAESLTLPWLLVAVLLLRAESANPRDAEVLYAEAEQWIELSMAADVARSATWQARRIDVDLCRAKRQKGAARLLSLRGMPSRHAQALARSEPPVLFAWIDVLAFWAECQFGDAALARYAEAEAMCVRLCELPSSADAAQRRRAEILRQRATIEQGGARLKSLDTAQALLDLLYERVPSADNALAVAVTALARGNVLPPEQAKEAYSHALMHAFMAEAEPRLRAESLQCRLAVQWAYENLPGMPMQSDVAISLTTRLEALRVQHPETVQRMAQVHLRNADFARAAELCENAWRNGQVTPALLATWRDICRQWASVSDSPDQLVVRQQAMRQLSIASAMR